MPYYSTKKFGPITTSHRNWHAANNKNRNSVKCSYIHGYSRYAEITFYASEFDDCGWVMDFGDCKDIKTELEKAWDHNVLINSDDPKLDKLKEMEQEGLIRLTIMDVTKNHGAGIEGSCKWLFDMANCIIQSKTNGRVRVEKVQIWEHEFNTAIYERAK